MNIVILHNAVASEDSPEDQDTLTQVAAVSAALCRLGHQTSALGCTLNLAEVRDVLLQRNPAAVVNLVESLGGSDSLAHLVSALLDTLRLPYTGSHTEALFAANHKLIAKRTMRQAGLPTPPWLAVGPSCRDGLSGLDQPGSPEQLSDSDRISPSRQEGPTLQPPCIIKLVWEHGSRGLDDENVIREGDTSPVRQRLEDFIAATGRPHFAEAFIDGREFNVPLLEGPDGPQVLPPAEIVFSAYPEGKPRIVGHRAKWHESSFEFNNTPRNFRFGEIDRRLVESLRQMALECWRLFDLRGYVRVDFRVDRAGQPWILEINANPCLSPDAGFAAALAEAGIGYDEACQRIVESAIASPQTILV